MDIKLKLFAFDNCLFNTADASDHTYRQLLSAYNIEYPSHIKVFDGDGKTEEELIKLLLRESKKGILSTLAIAQMCQLKKMIYHNNLSEITINEKCFELLVQRSSGTKAAIVSSANRATIEDVLEMHHMTKLVDFIIAREDVDILKPNPECYKKALKEAKINAAYAVAYEGGNHGFTAAVKAGITAIDIRRT